MATRINCYLSLAFNQESMREFNRNKLEIMIYRYVASGIPLHQDLQPTENVQPTSYASPALTLVQHLGCLRAIRVVPVINDSWGVSEALHKTLCLVMASFHIPVMLRQENFSPIHALPMSENTYPWHWARLLHERQYFLCNNYIFLGRGRFRGW